jgi:hypothetical protein
LPAHFVWNAGKTQFSAQKLTSQLGFETRGCQGESFGTLWKSAGFLPDLATVGLKCKKGMQNFAEEKNVAHPVSTNAAKTRPSIGSRPLNNQLMSFHIATVPAR